MDASILRLGNYEVDTSQKIGKGAFGTVFRGKHIRKKIPIAVKKCHSTTVNEVHRTEREVCNLRALPDHRNIVKFYDTQTTYDHVHKAEIVWIMLELCDLGNLALFLQRLPEQSLDLDTRLIIMEQCVMGVSHLHSQKPPIVHRDLKPENILFKSCNKSKCGFVVKICDFGLAKILRDSTELRTIAGTSLYMAPELLLEKHNYSCQVDIFSLGLVFLALQMFSLNGELLPISASAIRKRSTQSVGIEMLTAKVEKMEDPEVVVHNRMDSPSEKAIKEIISSMVVYDPDNRCPLQQAQEKIKKLPKCIDKRHIDVYVKLAEEYPDTKSFSMLSYILGEQKKHIMPSSCDVAKTGTHSFRFHSETSQSCHQLQGANGNNTYCVSPNNQTLRTVNYYPSNGLEIFNMKKEAEKTFVFMESRLNLSLYEESKSHRLTHELLGSAYHGNLEHLQKLYTSGASMSSGNLEGRTALHLAAAEGRLDCVRYLLEECQVPHSPLDRHGQTPLDEARRINHWEMIDYFELHIQNVEIEQKKSLVYSLMHSAKEGNLKKLEELYSSGTDMSLVDDNKRSALHLASSEGHVECVRFLLETCHVNSCPKDRFANTPLQDARKFDQKDVTIYLEGYLAQNPVIPN